MESDINAISEVSIMDMHVLLGRYFNDSAGVVKVSLILEIRKAYTVPWVVVLQILGLLCS